MRELIAISDDPWRNKDAVNKHADIEDRKYTRTRHIRGHQLNLRPDIDEQAICLEVPNLCTDQILGPRPFGAHLKHNIRAFELDGSFVDWLLILLGVLRLKGCCCKPANQG
jgi:hypothetical protein